MLAGQSCGSGGETEDEQGHTAAKHIFLPFDLLVVMTAITEACKSMRNPAGFIGCTQPNTINQTLHVGLTGMH